MPCSMPPRQVAPETEGQYMKRPLFSTAVSAAASLVVAGLAASATYSQTQTQLKGEVKIALISRKSGPLEAFFKQTTTGFNLGLD